MKQEFEHLLELYLQQGLSAEEERSFAELLRRPENQLYLTAVLDEQLADESKTISLGEPDGKRILEELLAKIGKPARSASFIPLRKMGIWRWAAVLFLMIGSATYFWLSGTRQDPTDTVNQTAVIAPGRTGALLTLADGTMVSLDTLKNGLVAMQGGMVAKVVDGMLLYEGRAEEVMYNTMSVPKGRQYHLTLPDGTGVWLNAASSIRYPTVFDKQQRRVTITGEAYFEVKKGAPFVLDVDGRAEVMVLGTRFNVNSYPNEKDIKTTLVEGSVKVSRGEDNMILRPGQQALVGKKISVTDKVDIDQVLAWKNGLFNFDEVGLEELLRQLERWYDIEVVYENGRPDIAFVGKMTRNITLNDLLVILEKSKVHFRLEGRKLIVMQ